MIEIENSENIFRCEKCGYTLFTQIDKITFDCQNCGYRNRFLIK